MAKMINVKLTLNEFILGSAAANPTIYKDFIASKTDDPAKAAEEVDAISTDDMIAKGKTVFPRNAQGEPIMWDYQIKGFFKDSAGMLHRVPGSKTSKVKAYKKEIDGLLFVYPRQIVIQNAGEITDFERALRASTPQGDRTALACSERIEAGCFIEFQVECERDDMVDWLIEMFDYGRKRGLGQWRNSGAGRFTFEMTDAQTGELIASN